MHQFSSQHVPKVLPRLAHLCSPLLFPAQLPERALGRLPQILNRCSYQCTSYSALPSTACRWMSAERTHQHLLRLAKLAPSRRAEKRQGVEVKQHILYKHLPLLYKEPLSVRDERDVNRDFRCSLRGTRSCAAQNRRGLAWQATGAGSFAAACAVLLAASRSVAW